MEQNFDVVVVGAGPGGYIAAIRCAQLGLKTACVDYWSRKDGNPAPGGTCTNAGCIPSKALLQSSEHYTKAQRDFFKHGIDIKSMSLNLPQMMARKDEIVRQSNEGILFLFRKNKVSFFHGVASFESALHDGYRICVSVNGVDERQVLNTKHVIIATGSHPAKLNNLEFDEERILSSKGTLSMSSVPKRFGIIGAGVIGLEMGSLWQRLGSEVVLFEAAPKFLINTDRQIAEEAYRQYTRQGLSFELGVHINGVSLQPRGVKVEYKNSQDKVCDASFDCVMIAIGRTPNTKGLNSQTVGLALDDRGFIVVDDMCRTNLENIWAIGDVVRGPMLAHKAEEEGIAVAECIAGQKGVVNFNTIPNVIYTNPEVATVGKTEEMLQSEGIEYKVGTFPFLANGRARAIGETAGLAKILSDAQTDEVLGVHIVGAMASELIAEAAMAMEFHACSEDIARICHAHPTLSEVIREAALSADNRALNY